MRGSGAAGTLCVLVLLGAPLFSGALADPDPVPASVTYASPHEAAWAAVERLRDADGRYLDREGSVPFVRDQMLSVLLLVYRASLFPADASLFLAQAREVWNATQPAYHAQDHFFDVTLTTPSVCVQLEANAWALWAALHLASATGEPSLRASADDLAATLDAALAPHPQGAVPRCPPGADPPPSQWPLPLLALLEHANQTGSMSSRDAAFNRLRSEIDARFDQAFSDPSGLYLAAVNAQYLLVLQSAARISPDEFASSRDALARFLVKNSLEASGDDFWVLNVKATGPGAGAQREGDPDPLAQLWTALALHNERRIAPTIVIPGDAPERLLESARARFWSPTGAGLAGADGAPILEPNALAALFTQGSRVLPVSAEAPRLSIVVPSAANFVYPNLTSPEAGSYFVLNEWTFRFLLDAVAPLPQRVLVPADRLGPLRLGYPPTRYTPAPVLFSSGVVVGVTVSGTEFPILDFVAGPEARSTSYRLLAHAPVFPASAHVLKSIQVFLASEASVPLTLDALTLDLAASDIRVTAVRFNDQPLASNAFEVRDVGATDFLETPHTRLELHHVEVRPHAQNELFVAYEDDVNPTLGAPTLSRDPDAREPLVAKDGVFRVGPRSKAYVRIEVRDNAALKSVFLVAAAGANATETRMTPSPTESGIFTAPLPKLPPNQPVALRVRAVDQHDHANATAEFLVEAESSLFREGNVILLVFSATLFFTALGIYVKMGRRRAP